MPRLLLKQRECAHGAEFSPDGRWLALVGAVWPDQARPSDGPLGNFTPLASLWSTDDWSRTDLEVPPTGKPLIPPVSCVFSPDSQWLALLTLDRRLHAYRFHIAPQSRRKRWLLQSTTNLGGTQRVGINMNVDRVPQMFPLRVTEEGAFLAIPSSRAYRARLTPSGLDPMAGGVELWEFPKRGTSAPTPAAPAPEGILHHTEQLAGTVLIPGTSSLVTVVDKEPTVRIWNVATGEKEVEFRYDADVRQFEDAYKAKPHGLHKSLAASSDGESIAIGMERFLGVFRPDGTRVGYCWHPKNRIAGDLAFHPSGRWIMAYGGEVPAGTKKRQPRLFIWSAPELELVASIEWNGKGETNLSHFVFSPDGELFAGNGYGVRVRSFRAVMALAGIDIGDPGPAIAELPDSH